MFHAGGRSIRWEERLVGGGSVWSLFWEEGGDGKREMERSAGSGSKVKREGSF